MIEYFIFFSYLHGLSANYASMFLQVKWYFFGFFLFGDKTAKPRLKTRYTMNIIQTPGSDLLGTAAGRVKAASLGKKKFITANIPFLLSFSLHEK